MLTENIALALEALKANKMRAFLTMLGIIIGISSVISIITIGNAITTMVSSELESFGTNIITVSVQERTAVGDDMGDQGSGSMNLPDDEDLLTDEMILAFQTKYADKVAGIGLEYPLGAAAAKDGRLYSNVSLMGVNHDYQPIYSVKMDKGRFISEDDVKAYRNVAVVSDKLAAKMFPDEVDPIGREVKVFGTDTIDTFTVIGVFTYEVGLFSGTDTGPEEDLRTNLYIPVSTAKQASALKNYNGLTVMVYDDVDMTAFTKETDAYFASLYQSNSTWKTSVGNFESLIATINSTLNLISIAFSVIAGISLLVGGIGVMNIMLVSVTERTVEIGIRKALGARNFHVRLQFVIEAGIISMIGGAVGIAIGLLIGVATSLILGTAVSVSPYVIAISLSFSTMIGLFFGYYPANKAALLDPIDALRH